MISALGHNFRMWAQTQSEPNTCKTGYLSICCPWAESFGHKRGFRFCPAVISKRAEKLGRNHRRQVPSNPEPEVATIQSKQRFPIRWVTMEPDTLELHCSECGRTRTLDAREQAAILAELVRPSHVKLIDCACARFQWGLRKRTTWQRIPEVPERKFEEIVESDAPSRAKVLKEASEGKSE